MFADLRRTRHLFTSESVSMGHPDKVSDQISDGILDSILEHDPLARVACETLVTTGLVVLAGEVTVHNAAAERALEKAEDTARQVIREIGYNDPEIGFDYRSCAVLRALHGQSADIARGVDKAEDNTKEQGAGDQGLMFGYACDETPELMPLPIMLAHQLVARLSEVRRQGVLDYLRPDGKSQVSVEYHDGKPVRLDAVVVSTQHSEDVSTQQLRAEIRKYVIDPVLPKGMVDAGTKYHINPTGRFVVGGPHGDTGLTGRKIIVDTYGGMGRHGGGCFSGKDPTKVDRSACYMARYVAKNIVAAGLARRCEVQLAYAIGVAEPVSIMVNAFGTGVISEHRMAELVREVFDMRPRAIIEQLDLLRPIYRKTAAYGHFGRELPEFTWEKTDKAAILKQKAGL